MEDHDSIELQSNSKRARIEVNIANLSIDHSLRKKILTTILVIETKVEEHIYKKDIVNHLTIIFHKHDLKKHGITLIKHGSKNILTR
jgi:hypothetical protein